MITKKINSSSIGVYTTIKTLVKNFEPRQENYISASVVTILDKINLMEVKFLE